jgi:hypothetical protein
VSALVWIAVPQGRVLNGKAVLSVVITPQLTESLTDAGMTDWPLLLNAQGVKVTVQTRQAGSTTPDATAPPATLRSAARSDVWRQFSQDLAVVPFTRPRGYHPPAVAKTSEDATKVRDTYKRATFAVADPQKVEEQLQNWRGEGEPVRQAVPDLAVRRDEKPDFHRAVAMLREHPEMLRLLGLIVDVELEGLPESTADREISVTWEASPVPVESRWTRYEFDGSLFLPASDGDIAAGMVDLTVPGRWRIVTFDVDAGVAKLRGAARSLSEDRSRRNEGAPSAGSVPSLPALRSAGMMLTRVGREERLTRKSAQGLAASAGGDADKVLMAEDLALGYRIDVRPQDSDTWFSLHRRHATYAMGDVEIVVEDEEGHVKPHAAVIDDAGLHTDEVVARWDGWSLSLPRPRLDGSPSPVRRNGLVQMDYEFEVRYLPVPASLVELEFGRAYQLRARVADLAGGGLGLRDAAAGSAADLETYVRYEPIPPPRLVSPDGLMVVDDQAPGGFRIDSSVVGPGGSLERLVIRSEPTDDGFSTTGFDGDPAYPHNHGRRVEPPVTTFAIAEQHGVLRLTDEAGVTNASRAFFGGRAGEVALDGGAAGPMPDPAALGMAAAVLVQPGLLDEEGPDDRPWEGTWPDVVGKSVELAAGPRGSRPRVRWLTEDDQTSPDGAASPRVQVVLPPGCQVDVELTSTVLGDWIDRFALNRFLSEGSPEGSPTAAQNAMVAGRHPLMSPPRPLMLTHAVRRPLEKPHGKASADRHAGETVARILPTDDPLWGVHVPSTGSVDVTATWEEWGDAPAPTSASAAVAQLNVQRGATSLPGLSHDFGDTKHRMVTFGLTAVSRFRDCFAETDEASLFRLDGALDPVPVPSTARPRPPVVVSVVPAFAWQEERGSGTVTRHRLSGRLRVELARPWFTTGEGEALAVVVWPHDEASLPDELREQVTWSNRDPIHTTPAPPVLPGESMFTGFQGSPVDVRLFEDGPDVRALVYPVFFHEGHWYADVEVPGVAAASYSPFVRLAVARFQGESLLGPGLDLRMSTVVTADLAPVLPDRHLVVRRAAGGLDFTLSGLARVSDTQANRVFASLERFAPGASPDGVDLTSLALGDPGFPAWVRVAGATVTGTVNQALPTLGLPADAGPLRLVVREVEELHSNVSALGVDAPSELADRTVFVDVVDLSDL